VDYFGADGREIEAMAFFKRNSDAFYSVFHFSNGGLRYSGNFYPLSPRAFRRLSSLYLAASLVLLGVLVLQPVAWTASGDFPEEWTFVAIRSFLILEIAPIVAIAALVFGRKSRRFENADFEACARPSIPVYATIALTAIDFLISLAWSVSSHFVDSLPALIYVVLPLFLLAPVFAAAKFWRLFRK
jgi:hypothetical protein